MQRECIRDSDKFLLIFCLDTLLYCLEDLVEHFLDGCLNNPWISYFLHHMISKEEVNARVMDKTAPPYPLLR